MPLYYPRNNVLDLDLLLDGYGTAIKNLDKKIKDLEDGYLPIDLTIATNVAEPLQKDIDDGKTITFPIYYKCDESESESSTTALVMKNKLTITTATLPAGMYRIGFYYEWCDSSPSANFIGQVKIDDNFIAYTCSEISDNSQEAYIAQSGFKYIELQESEHSVHIDYCSSKSGKPAKIRRARLEFWRIR